MKNARVFGRVTIACVGVGMLSAVGQAQTVNVTVTRLYQDLDLVLDPMDQPIGAITSFGGVAVNNAGTHLVEITTNNPDANANVVVMRDGVLFAQENDPINGGPVAVSSFDSNNLNGSGNVAWNTFFRNATTSTDSGIRFNSTLVLQEGTVSTAPGFSANTPYIGFFEVRGDDHDDFMVMASVDDPAIPSTVDRAIVIFDYDPMSNTYTESVLWKEGDVLPGMTAAVSDFGTGPENMARSANGQHTMFIVASVGGATDSIYINSTLIAQETQPSPLRGRNFRILTSVPVSVNNVGDYAYRATLDGDAATDVVIFHGNEVVAQEGGDVPGIPGFRFTSFGTGPIFVDNSGNVIWFGDWDDPDTTRDRGLFRNQQLILREGDLVEGNAITNILGVSEGYNASPDGRYVIVKVQLAVVGDAVLLLTLDASCVADVDDGSGTGTPDGGVTIDDLLYYLAIFEAGLIDADVDNGTGTGTPDGGVTIDDLLYFLQRFEGGC